MKKTSVSESQRTLQLVKFQFRAHANMQYFLRTRPGQVNFLRSGLTRIRQLGFAPPLQGGKKQMNSLGRRHAFCFQSSQCPGFSKYFVRCATSRLVEKRAQTLTGPLVMLSVSPCSTYLLPNASLLSRPVVGKLAALDPRNGKTI